MLNDNVMSTRLRKRRIRNGCRRNDSEISIYDWRSVVAHNTTLHVWRNGGYLNGSHVSIPARIVYRRSFVIFNVGVVASSQ